MFLFLCEIRKKMFDVLLIFDFHKQVTDHSKVIIKTITIKKL